MPAPDADDRFSPEACGLIRADPEPGVAIRAVFCALARWSGAADDRLFPEVCGLIRGRWGGLPPGVRDRLGDAAIRVVALARRTGDAGGSLADSVLVDGGLSLEWNELMGAMGEARHHLRGR